MNTKKIYKQYANLLLEFGLQFKSNEILLLEIDVDNYEFAQIISLAAFEKGAEDVAIFYNDTVLDNIRIKNTENEEYQNIPKHIKEQYKYYLDKGKCCSLSLKSPHFFGNSNLDETQSAKLADYYNDIRNIIRKEISSNGLKWCVAKLPNKLWAKKIFESLDEIKAEEKLTKTLMDLVMVKENNNPIDEWHKHMKNAKKYSTFFNKEKFKKIIFTNSLGTNLEVGFNPKCMWVGGMDEEQLKVHNMPNIPTAETSTSPDKYMTNGVVFSSMPIVVGGQMVDKFSITFKDGKVIDCHAKIGENILKRLVDTDEGSSYLGEVAFVECDSKISQTGLFFYDTLLDENAACHLALGKGFPICIQGLNPSDTAAYEKERLNFSKIHADFMFGTSDTTAYGIKNDDTKVLIFDNGKFIDSPENNF